MYFLQPISCLKYFGYVSEKWRISLFLESLKKEELGSQNSYFSMEWVGLAGRNSVANRHFRLGFSLPKPSYPPAPVSLSLNLCLPYFRHLLGAGLQTWPHASFFGNWRCEAESKTSLRSCLNLVLGWTPGLVPIVYPIVCYQGNTGIQDALSIGEVL